MKYQPEWNLKELASDDNDALFAEKRKSIETKVLDFAKKWQNRQDYLSDPKILKEALDEYEFLIRAHSPFNDEAYYFHLRTEQNANDPKLKGKYSDALNFAVDLENKLQFFSLNIAKILPENQKKILSSKHISAYRHFLEKLFNEQKHLLSEGEEKILNLKRQVAYSNWVKMTESFLAKEEREVLDENKKTAVKSFSEIFALMKSKDKKVRDDAAKAFNEILDKHSDVAEAELNSVLLDKKINDELRGFEKPELSRFTSDDIDLQTVDSMIGVVSENFKISKEYYQLKANLFRVPKLQYHERIVEYGEISNKYSYPEAVNLLGTVFEGIDSEFKKIFDNFVNDGRIDIYPKKGKRSGAFCSSNLITQPIYILLNYDETLDSVKTFAHEIGHGINDELMKKQNALNFGNSLAVAEVASTFMEDFVLKEISRELNEDDRLSLLLLQLDAEVSEIFRQVACFNFERELHENFREKGYLSKAEIGELFLKHMYSYMGDYVEQSPASENWWVYWNHIRAYFYNYSYANGLLISKALQKKVSEDKKNVEKVKQFLSAGTSISPKQIFKNIGINIDDSDFWKSGMRSVSELLEEAKALAKKLNKF